MSITRLSAVGAALLMLTVLTISRSNAAFSATTDNSSNTFSTGSIALTDDDSDVALFTVTDMEPNTPVVECIELDYAGSATTAVIKLFGTSTGTLDTYLDTKIEVGTGGQFGNCTGFTASGSAVYDSNLAAFSTAHTSYANGVTLLSTTATTATRVIRFTIELQDDNNAQGLSSTAEFNFEVQG